MASDPVGKPDKPEPIDSAEDDQPATPTASERPFPNGGTSGILPHQSVMTFMAMLRTHSCLLGSLSVQGAQMSV